MAGLAFLLLMLVGAGSLIWHMSRSEEVLQHWAARNGYRLLEHKSVHFFKGPFFWTSSKGQSVYRVLVEDQAGRRRSGWVRCGSWWRGILSDQVEVHWDE